MKISLNLDIPNDLGTAIASLLKMKALYDAADAGTATPRLVANSAEIHDVSLVKETIDQATTVDRQAPLDQVTPSDEKSIQPPPIEPPPIEPPPIEPPPATSPTTTDTLDPKDLDSEGIPWDARIHQTSKKKRKGDQTWMIQRGAIPEHVAKVKAELKALYASDTTTTTTTTGPPTTEPPHVPATGGTTEPLVNDDNQVDFVDLISEILVQTNSGNITQEQVDTVLSSHGLASLNAAMTYDDLNGLYSDLKEEWTA